MTRLVRYRKSGLFLFLLSRRFDIDGWVASWQIWEIPQELEFSDFAVTSLLSLISCGILVYNMLGKLRSQDSPGLALRSGERLTKARHVSTNHL